MDNMQGMISQIMQNQGGQPPQGGQTPQGEGQPGMDLGTNPFSQFSQGLGGGAAAPQPGPQVQEKNAAIGAAQGVENAVAANPQLEAGTNPGNSQNLLRASQSLEGYIKDSTDPDEIRMARTIIQLITRLISADQQKMASEL